MKCTEQANLETEQTGCQKMGTEKLVGQSVKGMEFPLDMMKMFES